MVFLFLSEPLREKNDTNVVAASLVLAINYNFYHCHNNSIRRNINRKSIANGVNGFAGFYANGVRDIHI